MSIWGVYINPVWILELLQYVDALCRAGRCEKVRPCMNGITQKCWVGGMNRLRVTAQLSYLIIITNYPLENGITISAK